MAFGEFMSWALAAIQTIIVYGILAFIIWKLVRIEINTKQIANQLAEVSKALIFWHFDNKETLFRTGYAYEQVTEWHKKRPAL